MSDTQTTRAPYKAESRPQDSASGPFRTEDWWAVWIGLGIIVVAYLLFASGTSIKWLAVAPAKWATVGQAASDLGRHGWTGSRRKSRLRTAHQKLGCAKAATIKLHG